MAEYIERKALLDELCRDNCERTYDGTCHNCRTIETVADFPTVDVVEVVRCGECIYYHPAHIKCPDGIEKGYNEMPAEAFDELGTGLVTLEYGINIGGQCEVEKYSGYSEDKSVFRRSDDFCSRGQGKERKNNG